jgi:hypothetical protein
MTVAALVVVLITLVASSAGIGPFAELAGSQCWLGYGGADATIEIVGKGASDQCNGSTGTGTGLYVEDRQAPRGGLVCRHSIAGLTYTVRDTGMHLVGSQLCENIAAVETGRPGSTD